MLRPKLLALFSDPSKKALLQLEITATVDWGEPFVKACYFLEGDGPLAPDCHEAMERISAAIHTAHTPNVQTFIERMIPGIPPSDPRRQQLVAYTKSCVQPGLDYFQHQLNNSLRDSLAFFKCARMFSPQKVHLLQPNATALERSLLVVPFLNT